MLSPEEEHQRFIQQAGWTKTIRQYAFQQMGLQPVDRVLEVGCGEGVILADLSNYVAGRVYGLDKNPGALQYAHRKYPAMDTLTCGDMHYLPYPAGFFDLTLCHFTLLWVENPGAGLQEMRRVTRPGGWVAALAEPDYGGRIDYPETLTALGQMQGQVLSQLGADPNLGRKLGALLHQAGVINIQTGVLGGQWADPFSETEWNGEWAILEADLAGKLGQEELEQLRQIDHRARQAGERSLFVPTFYGWGKAP